MFDSSSYLLIPYLNKLFVPRDLQTSIIFIEKQALLHVYSKPLLLFS